MFGFFLSAGENTDTRSEPPHLQKMSLYCLLWLCAANNVRTIFEGQESIFIYLILKNTPTHKLTPHCYSLLFKKQKTPGWELFYIPILFYILFKPSRLLFSRACLYLFFSRKKKGDNSKLLLLSPLDERFKCYNFFTIGKLKYF